MECTFKIDEYAYRRRAYRLQFVTSAVLDSGLCLVLSCIAVRCFVFSKLTYILEIIMGGGGGAVGAIGVRAGGGGGMGGSGMAGGGGGMGGGM